MLGILVCCVFLLDDAHIPLCVGAVTVVADCIIARVLDKSCGCAHGVTSFLRNASFTARARSFDRACFFIERGWWICTDPRDMLNRFLYIVSLYLSFLEILRLHTGYQGQ